MQIRAVMVPYRIELRRRNSRVTEHVRLSGGALLDRLERAIGRDPDLQAALSAARIELGVGRPFSEGGGNVVSAPISPPG